MTLSDRLVRYNRPWICNPPALETVRAELERLERKVRKLPINFGRFVDIDRVRSLIREAKQ